MTRITPTTPMKQRTSAGIRKLAAQVAQTFPDMSVHDHLADAARELDSGRTEGARRHLNAAIEGFAPLQITRHGVHDDQGHMAAKLYMQQAYRHLLNVKDIDDVRARNEGFMEQKRAMAAASGKTFLPSSQPVPVGAPNGAPGPVAAAPAVSPQAQHLKALSWEDLDGVIGLATFAGAKPGSGKNFSALKGALAKRGARNPGALAAYIGRKKYGRKGFAKLGQKHANPAGGVELTGPGGWSHGWLRQVEAGASLEATAGRLNQPFGRHLSKREARGFANMFSSEGHKHKLHRLVAEERARRAMIQASSTGAAVELVGPGGWSHGWLRSAQVSREGGDEVLANIQLQRGARAAGVKKDKLSQQIAGELRSAQVAREGGDSVLAHIHENRARDLQYQQELAARKAKKAEAATPGTTFGKKVAGWNNDVAAWSASGSLEMPPGPPTIQFSWADVLDAIELTGPKGYSHGWVFHGIPKTRAAMIKHIAEGHQLGLPTGRTGFNRETRTYEDFVKVHEDLHAAHPGQLHSHGPAVTADARTYRRDASAAQKIQDFEALASMPAFSPAQSKMLGIADPAYYAKIKQGIMATIQASWEDIDAAILLSADTGRLATEPHPFGKPGGPGLWGVKGMELPPYIQNIARALLRTGRAKTLSQAIAIARGASKRWAAGGGNVRPEVRAASAATSADWSAKQARAHAHSWGDVLDAIELAGFNPAQARTPVGTWGGGGTTASAGLSKQQLRARVKADRAKLKLLTAQLAKLTVVKQKTTKAAQKAGATGKTAAATPAKKGAPARKGPAGKKAPTRGQLITSLRAQIHQLNVQIAADLKQIALANEPDGILLAS